mmetsp:Transcript_17962/g.23263  ORF Transcript_17962/g.23263 Transcript_17962/m.23263 type:complete len:320 (+) Transcript_17962:160-1119(+)
MHPTSSNNIRECEQAVVLPNSTVSEEPNCSSHIKVQQKDKTSPKYIANSVQSPLAQALNQGIAGAGAMAINITTLMWVRTTTYYQYRHGTGTIQAMRALYQQGGISRFYSGYPLALIHGPISRFGDTAANAGVLCLLDNNEATRNLSVTVKSGCASTAASMWRVFLMPMDTVKSVLQVEGRQGLVLLANKVKTRGPTVLYHGSLAAATSNFLGHYPWFLTFNYLDSTLPLGNSRPKKLLRTAFVGFCASVAADITSNSIRVLKTYRQTYGDTISYMTAVQEIMKKEGLSGVFTRGLKTKLLGNGVQGIMFSILWKFLQE